MLLIMELIVFVMEKVCKCFPIKAKHVQCWDKIDTITMSDFRDNQIKK